MWIIGKWHFCLQNTNFMSLSFQVFSIEQVASDSRPPVNDYPVKWFVWYQSSNRFPSNTKKNEPRVLSLLRIWSGAQVIQPRLIVIVQEKSATHLCLRLIVFALIISFSFLHFSPLRICFLFFHFLIKSLNDEGCEVFGSRKFIFNLLNLYRAFICSPSGLYS